MPLAPVTYVPPPQPWGGDYCDESPLMIPTDQYRDSILGPNGGGLLPEFVNRNSEVEQTGEAKSKPATIKRDDSCQVPKVPELETSTRLRQQSGQSDYIEPEPFRNPGQYEAEQANPSGFGQRADEDQQDLNSVFPDGLPRYRQVSNFHEIGAYLANANHDVSLGGPALKDMSYGIIVVPAGEEKTLTHQTA